MATVNFSVPDQVKRAFNDAFRGENKSAVIARLMQQAVEDRLRQKRRAAAIDAILELRRRQPPVSDSEISGVMGEIVESRIRASLDDVEDGRVRFASQQPRRTSYSAKLTSRN